MSVAATLSLLRSTGQIGSQEPAPSTPSKKRKREKTAQAVETVFTDSVDPNLSTPPRNPKNSGPIIPVSPDTPDQLISPEVRNNATLRSPMWYHRGSSDSSGSSSTGSLSEKAANPNKEFRKFVTNMKKDKSYRKTVVFGSGGRDPDTIRAKKLKPNEKGIIEVPSSSGSGSRLWAIHPRNNDDGTNRLYPVKEKGSSGKKVLTFQGTDLASLIDSHDHNKLSFEDHVLSQIGPTKRKSDIHPTDTSTASTSPSDSSIPLPAGSPLPLIPQ